MNMEHVFQQSGLYFPGPIKITDNISFTSSSVRGRTVAVDTTFMSCAQVFPWKTQGCEGSDDW